MTPNELLNVPGASVTASHWEDAKAFETDVSKKEEFQSFKEYVKECEACGVYEQEEPYEGLDNGL